MPVRSTFAGGSARGFSSSINKTAFIPSRLTQTVGWFDATDSSSSFLTDKISGATLTNNGVSYNSVGINSLPAMQSTGESPTLTRSSVPSTWPTGTTEGWTFILAKISDGGYNTPDSFAYGASGASRSIGLGGHDDGNNSYPYLGMQSGTSSTKYINYASNQYNSNMLLAGRFANNALELWLNGTQVGTSASALTSTGATNIMFFGSFGGSRVVGFIGQAIVTTALTTDQRQLIEGYIAWKYSLSSILPSGHTWKSTSPVY